MNPLRKLENLHIVFWLFKDASWAADVKWLGTLMILPTLAIAIYLLLRNWHDLADRFHNLAITFWITANSLWMVGEFFKMDEAPYHLRKWCLIPFLIGIIIVLVYYIFLRKRLGVNTVNE
jgi:hypothetical protein